MWADAALILGSYIFGSTPHLYLLARLRHVRLDGDYHMDLWNKAGKITGVIGVLGEFVKGVVPVLVGRGLDFDLTIVAVAGLAAVCGQMWPVFSRFDGEKGNSIALAMVMTLITRSALVAIIPVIVSLLVRTVPRLVAKVKSSDDRPVIGGSHSRSLPVGMTICFLILPFVSWYFGEPPGVIWCCTALFILIMVRRLTAGLGEDLNTGADIKGILIRRLIFDRATAGWRQ